jgi:hypothetical protein
MVYQRMKIQGELKEERGFCPSCYTGFPLIKGFRGFMRMCVTSTIQGWLKARCFEVRQLVAQGELFKVINKHTLTAVSSEELNESDYFGSVYEGGLSQRPIGRTTIILAKLAGTCILEQPIPPQSDFCLLRMLGGSPFPWDPSEVGRARDDDRSAPGDGRTGRRRGGNLASPAGWL